jgi:serine/threonine-protein kinase
VTQPPPPPEPSTAQPIADTRTFTSRGGTVEARCNAAGKAALVSWTPADPYQVQKVTEGPAITAAVVFKKAASRIRMTVTCVAGTPTVVTLPL